MRRLVRGPLPKRIRSYLTRKQSQVNAGREARRTWETARRTKSMRAVAEELGRMTGVRQRCMFCEDSRGNDIDHYWPLSRYPARSFVWENMLWLCAGCNRHKGDRFELDGAGNPLLIDRTTEDPWDHLFYDSHTGNITGRYDRAAGRFDPRGAYTTDIQVLPLNIEAVTEGRQRTHRNLKRAVNHFLATARQGGDRSAAGEALVESVRDNDAFGLGKWFFERDGSAEEPFRALKDGFPQLWQAIASIV